MSRRHIEEAMERLAERWESTPTWGEKPSWYLIDEIGGSTEMTGNPAARGKPADAGIPKIPPEGIEVRVYGHDDPPGRTEKLEGRMMGGFEKAYRGGRDFRLPLCRDFTESVCNDDLAPTKVYQLKVIRVSDKRWRDSEMALVEVGYKPPFALSMTDTEMFI